MKKLVISVVFAIILTITMSISVFAIQEIEANDSAESATFININSTVYGNLSSKNDVDWYKFTVSQRGYFYVDFNHELIDSTSRYWIMRLYDSTAKSYIDGNDSYFYWTGQSNGETNTFGVEPGTYYIKINKDYFSDKEYNFTVKFTAAYNTETENNNSKENADPISVNETYQGALSTNGDVDWYKFTVNQDGYFYVNFDHELIDSTSRYWIMRLYDSTGVNFIDGNSSYFYWTGKSTDATNTFGIKAGTYYIKINDDYYTGDSYNLCVKFTAEANWETENNNDKESADFINVNQIYNGSLSTDGDVDWYKFTVEQDGYFYVNFDHELIDSTSRYWIMRLYDSTGVNFIDGNSSYFYWTGKSTGATNTFGIKAGTYYIKINDDYYSGINYKLSVNFVHAGNWEKENNNSKDSANNIYFNSSMNGSLSTDGDLDWYKFTVSSDSKIAVEMNYSPVDSSSTYWVVNLYDSSAVTNILSMNCKGNNASTTSEYMTLSAGTYYIRVTDNYYSGSNYNLIVKEMHDCIGVFETVKNPTCTEPGVQEKSCGKCHKLLDTQTIPANGHTCNNWAVEKEATCSSEGQRYCVCSVCKEIVAENIPTTPHSYGEWNVIQETSCYQAGAKERECYLCGYEENVIIEQLSHEYSQWEVVSGSKLIPPIVKEKTCVNCADVQSVQDWSYVWVTVVAAAVLIGVLIGVINYFKAFKRR